MFSNSKIKLSPEVQNNSSHAVKQSKA